MICSRFLKALGLATIFVSQTARAAPDNDKAAGIDPAHLSAITRQLASDEFEGREPGTPGEQKTVAYIVEKFKAIGLKPAGPDNSWTQPVPLLKTQIADSPRVSISGGGDSLVLAYPDEIYFSTSRETGAIAVRDAPVVFVGYGAFAPERDWDDFKEADLRGKVVLFLVNDPDFEASAGEDASGRFGDKAMTYYGRWSYKFEEAQRRGAIAALVVHETEAAGYGWNVVAGPRGINYSLDKPGMSLSTLAFSGWITHNAAVTLLKLAGQDFEELKKEARTKGFRPVDLNITLSVATRVTAERITSQNILAMLPGTKAADEAIIYGAHWDAFGKENNEEGRTVVHHGAIDNALGIGGVIEVARAFTKGPPPKRSIIFAAWTAEERGLLGAEYYAEHPTVPLEKTVANFTFDVLQTLGEARNFVLIGKGQSDLEDLASKAVEQQGRIITQEMYPERGMFFRSDHFAFAKRGVPALVTMGLAGDPDAIIGGTRAGAEWIRNYTQNCYHQECDAWSPDWDLTGAAQDVGLFYRVGDLLANSAIWPQWKPGSEFRKLRISSDAARKPQ
tara:strand:+ start:43460 stop:45145 length:1686 start_codon:yes stop_codon:yes gene_type:complete